MENDVREIKGYISRQQVTDDPVLSLNDIDDDMFKVSISGALMRYAEQNGRWTTIGIDQWIECGM